MYYYVYILQSKNFPQHHYTGITTDLKKRIKKHNNGEVSSTSKYKPWQIQTVTAFHDKEKALAFEKYLKTHSGRAFAKKHFRAKRKTKTDIAFKSRKIKKNKVLISLNNLNYFYMFYIVNVRNNFTNHIKNLIFLMIYRKIIEFT